jgi:hypothetical protein
MAELLVSFIHVLAERTSAAAVTRQPSRRNGATTAESLPQFWLSDVAVPPRLEVREQLSWGANGW